jgi:peroxiredoxin
VVKLHEEYGDKLEFIGLNIGVNERLTRVIKFVEKKDYKMKILFDENKEVFTKFKIATAPTSIIIDKNGIIKYINMFAPENLDEILKELGEQSATEQPPATDAKVEESE